MTDLNLIFGAMVFMFTIAISMMAYDSCETDIFETIRENKRAEQRWMRQTVRELGEALNR